ncbi:hypothetical protein QQ045_030544 [Rhodiola kirilowii]
MKRRYMMLSLLISGPWQPGNDTDVYLAPLTDDLKLLWDEGNITNQFGKPNSRSESDPWKKRSIFVDLPYWHSLDIRHCIDVMHIEKNICESLLGTLLNIPGKTKDGVKARLDMLEMNIRTKLAPEPRGHKWEKAQVDIN